MIISRRTGRLREKRRFGCIVSRYLTGTQYTNRRKNTIGRGTERFLFFYPHMSSFLGLLLYILIRNRLIMKFSELPLETQENLNQKRSRLHEIHINSAYHILVYNEKGTRYFEAHRRSHASNWASFGGGSYWTISYGEVGFKAYRDPLGGVYYDLCFGRKFGKIGDLEIPTRLDKKSEVIDILKKIGKFNIQ